MKLWFLLILLQLAWTLSAENEVKQVEASGNEKIENFQKSGNDLEGCREYLRRFLKRFSENCVKHLL